MSIVVGHIRDHRRNSPSTWANGEGGRLEASFVGIVCGQKNLAKGWRRGRVVEVGVWR